jgi:20S proteasome subunit beta 4
MKMHACHRYVVMAADAQVARSILVYQRNKDKIMQVDSTKLMGIAGPQADCNMFGEYIEKNLALYELNNDMPLNTHAAASFVRRELATALRKGPYQCNILFAGVDGGAASLFWLDYMGTLQKVSYGAHGYGAAFTLSTMDRAYRTGLGKDEAVGIIKQCIAELQTRFLISQTEFVVKVMTASGVEVLQ